MSEVSSIYGTAVASTVTGADGSLSISAMTDSFTLPDSAPSSRWSFASAGYFGRGACYEIGPSPSGEPAWIPPFEFRAVWSNSRLLGYATNGGVSLFLDGTRVFYDQIISNWPCGSDPTSERFFNVSPSWNLAGKFVLEFYVGASSFLQWPGTDIPVCDRGDPASSVASLAGFSVTDSTGRMVPFRMFDCNETSRIIVRDVNFSSQECPQFIQQPQVVGSACEGREIIIRGVPSVTTSWTVSWKKNGVMLPISSRVVSDGVGTLTIFDASLEDSGLYSMVLENGCGATESTSVQVQVVSATHSDCRSCIADLTQDGVLNFFDIAAFALLYQQQDPAADFNADGLLNFFDFSAFLNAFNAGCP